MIISAKVVRRPRTVSMCPVRVSAACTVFLPAGEPRVRLYGCAETGDRPYAMCICVPCADAGAGGATDQPEKLRRVLELWRREQPAGAAR